MNQSKFPTEVTLCLSGGAARGAYQLGAISVLQDHNVKIKAISGTSIGALIGAALGCQKSADEIFDVISSKEFKSVFKPSFGKGYFFRLDDSAKVIDKLIDRASFEELSIPLTLCVCDVKDESAKYYNSGVDFKKLVLASCSIAPLFKPVELYGRTFVDGGVVDNFPVEQLQRYDYPIIGINLHPKYRKTPSSVFGWLKKNIHTAWQSQYYRKSNLCDIYLCNEELNNVKIFSFKDLQKAYGLGKKDMHNIMQEV
jgi:NTE family protein